MFYLSIHCRRYKSYVRLLYCYFGKVCCSQIFLDSRVVIPLTKSLFVRMTISSEVAVHQISFEHRVVNIG